MDGLVEELLRLEGAKHKALVEIDAVAYDENVRKQMRLLADSKAKKADCAADVESLLSLSQLITLNKRLFQNLVSAAPWFAFSPRGYSARGEAASAVTSARV